MSEKKAYIPPHLRKKKEPNPFLKNNPPPKSPSPVPPQVEDTDLFPELGNTVSKSTSTMNFAASAKQTLPPPPPPKKPDILPGWIVISRENGKIQYKFGEKPALDHTFMREYFARMRQLNNLDKMEARLDRLQELDLEINGPKYVHASELPYIQREWEREQELENPVSDSEEESEDEFAEDYEFNEDLVHS